MPNTDPNQVVMPILDPNQGVVYVLWRKDEDSTILRTYEEEQRVKEDLALLRSNPNEFSYLFSIVPLYKRDNSHLSIYVLWREDDDSAVLRAYEDEKRAREDLALVESNPSDCKYLLSTIILYKRNIEQPSISESKEVSHLAAID